MAVHFGGNVRDRDRPPEERTQTTAPAVDNPWGIEGIAAMVGAIGTKVVQNTASYLSALRPFVSIMSVILSIPAFWCLEGQRSWRGARVCWRSLYVLGWIAAIVVLYAVVSPYMVAERYMYPIMPLASVLCGVGIARWAEWAAADNRVRANSWAVLVAIALVYVPSRSSLLNVRHAHSKEALTWGDHAGHEEMAQALLKRDPRYAGLRVVTRKYYAAYHLRASQNVLMPFADQVGSIDADLLVADSLILRRYRPELAGLALGAYLPHPGRIIVCQVYPHYHRVITVYDLREKPVYSAPPAASLDERLRRAQKAVSQDNVWDAVLECRAVLREQADHPVATRILQTIEEQLSASGIDAPLGPPGQEH